MTDADEGYTTLHVRIPTPLYDRIVAVQKRAAFPAPLSSVARGLLAMALDAEEKKNGRGRR